MKWLVAGLFIATTGCFQGERVTTEYSTHAEAAADGAVERGWIPGFVPSSAVDLVEFHDLDTNEQVLRFSAPRDDLEQMVVGMAEVRESDARCPPPGVSGLRTYRASADRRYVALRLDEAHGRAHVWACAGDH